MDRENLKKVLLSAIAFSLNVLIILNYIHALSLFLNDLGPNMLPWALIIVSLLVIVHSLISAMLSDRYSSNKIFSGVLIFFFFNFLLLTFLPEGFLVHVFYFMVLTSFMIYLQEMLISNYANSILTPLQAKSYLPNVYGFINIGVIVGSLFAVPYQEFHEAVGIGWPPMIGVLLVWLLVLLTSKLYKREILENFSGASKGKFLPNLKRSFHFIFNNSSLYKALALVVFVVVGIQMCVEFKLKTVVAHSFGEETLTEVLALVFMIQSIVTWFFSEFFARRLLFRFGVSNMLIYIPISILLTTVVAITFNLNYLAAIALFLVFFITHHSYYGICISQILTLVPKELYQSVYFLIRGLLYAIALLVFSAVLLIYTYDITLETTINTALILGLSVVLLFVLLKLKSLYFKKIIANLYKDDLYLKTRSIDLLAEKSSKNRGEQDLRRVLGLDNIQKEVKSRVLTSLGIIGNYQSLVDLAKVLLNDESSKTKAEAIHAINDIVKRAKDLNKYPVTKHYLLKAYEQILLSDVPLYLKMETISALKYFDLEDVIEYLEEHLHSRSVFIQTNSIETLATFNDRGVIPYLEPFLESKNLRVLSAAIISLWKFKETHGVLMPKIAGVLVGKKRAAIENGLHIIGAIDAVWEKKYVLAQLDHKNNHVRTYALLTLIDLGEAQRIDDLVRIMLNLAKKRDKKEMEFIFSKYRHFSEPTKKVIISKIQQMKELEAQYFYEAFKNSRYVFTYELNALSKVEMVAVAMGGVGAGGGAGSAARAG